MTALWHARQVTFPRLGDLSKVLEALIADLETDWIDIAKSYRNKEGVWVPGAGPRKKGGQAST